MMLEGAGKIFVLGVGPGAPEYVLPAVSQRVRRCQVLVGGERNQALFPDFDGERKAVDSDIPSLLDYIQDQYRSRQVGVLVSGDPGLFSLLQPLKRRFSEAELEVIPGISALQYFFARLGLPWNDASIISLHGRDEQSLVRTVEEYARVGIFTDRRQTPAAVCARLLQAGIGERRVFVGENLSYPEEKIYSTTLASGCDLQVGELNVMVILS